MLVDYVYWTWEGEVDPEFCKFVLSRIDWDQNVFDGRIDQSVPDGRLDEKIRKSDIVWQNAHGIVGSVLQTFAREANINAGWNFDIEFPRSVQIARYKGDGGHYEWHRDVFIPQDGKQRKLSVVLLLNDSSEFEGGEFQFKEVKSFDSMRKVGSVIVFPSYMEHRVTPVTKGTRYTATCWIYGPAFK